jgi:hypothetical protein
MEQLSLVHEIYTVEANAAQAVRELISILRNNFICYIFILCIRKKPGRDPLLVTKFLNAPKFI